MKEILGIFFAASFMVYGAGLTWMVVEEDSEWVVKVDA